MGGDAIAQAFWAPVLAIAMMAWPALACAQVLEIDAAGGVTVYDRPTAFHADGSATSLAVQPPRSAAAARTSVTTALLVSRAAEVTSLSPDLIEAVGWNESRFHARVISPAGAIGEMQLMPATARALGVDPFDSQQNVQGGAIYLSHLMRRYNGDLVLALAAYNAGPGAVDKYGGVPPYKETRAYVGAILDRLSARSALPPSSTSRR